MNTYSYMNGSIKFHNCNVSNNTVQYSVEGGGVYIYSEKGSIEFSNCAIYNNTVQYDGEGGVSIVSFGNGSINFITALYTSILLRNMEEVYTFIQLTVVVLILVTA